MEGRKEPMNATFTDIHAAADYMGPGAIEVPLYQTEVFDICRRAGAFGQRIKQVPATGQPSRFFEQTAIPNPGTAGFVNPRSINPTVVSPTRVELSVPLKAIVAQINPLRHRARRSAKTDRLSPSQRLGRHGKRRNGGARRGVVEWQRHQPERADDYAVYGRSRSDRGRRQFCDRDNLDEDR